MLLTTNNHTQASINPNNVVLSRELKIISTFNGIGAFSDALKQLGILSNKIICEIDKKANQTYYANNEFITENHIDDINELLEIVPEGFNVDILIQTPPCQSFSIQGTRNGLSCDNGNLFLTAINLQKKVNANIVIYENVKGLLSHDKQTCVYTSLINNDYKNTIGNTLHTIELLLLEDDRYNYYWKIINSCDQGLPQNRERIFIIGILKELDTGFKFPDNIDLQFTVADILEDEVAENFYYNNIANHRLVPANQARRANRIHTYGKYEGMTFQSTSRVHYPYVAPCINTNNYAKFLVDGRVRTMTQTEAKKVHGFSEEFKLVGPKSSQNKELGNTVSPGVYKRLSVSIFNAIKTPKHTVANNITNNITNNKTKLAS